MDNRIVPAVLAAVIIAVGSLTYITLNGLGDRFNEVETKVSALEGASVTHVTKAQVKAALVEDLAAGGEISHALIALKGEIAAERDAAINVALRSALEPITTKVAELNTVVNSTTADGLKSVLAKIEETTKRHNAAIYGKERGIVQALTALAERHNEAHAAANVLSTDAAAVRAAEASVELDANSRETLSPFERMLAAVKGLSAKQYQEQKKIQVASRDNVPVPKIVRITVRGDQVKVEKIDPPRSTLRYISPPL